MSETLRRVQALVLGGEYSVTRHAFRELAADGIVVEDVLADIETAVLVEDYPDSRKEPSVLVLQHDRKGPLACHVGRSEGCRNSSRDGDGLPTGARALVNGL